MTLRKTKIIATLGPATNTEEMINKLADRYIDLIRLNFSHGTAQDHITAAALVRKVAIERKRPIGILCDLQGPKIRIGKFENKQIELKTGDSFILDSACELGNQNVVGLDYKNLPNEVFESDILVLDDGRIVFKVEKIEDNKIYCSVVVGGVLSNNKGINKKGGGLAADALTEKDKEDIKIAVALDADYIAVSFPKTADDIVYARNLVKEALGHAHIIAKIERAEAIQNLEEIIDVSDAIMVARGDLGVEVGDSAVPGLQKRMIKLARSKNKLTITATQMMESMINNPIPTRAEVSDVANAVLDGTDAVMLSAESASGKYPLEAVEAMHRVCKEAEKSVDSDLFAYTANKKYTKVGESIAMAAVNIAEHMDVAAIVNLTESGASTKFLSRVNNLTPIFALSSRRETRRKLTLHRGVYPFPFEQSSEDRDEILHEVERELLDRKLVSIGDLVIMTIGEPIGKSGGTNTLKIVKVGNIK